VGALLGAWIVWDVTLRQAHLQALDPAPTRELVRAVPPAARPQQIIRGPDGMPVAGWYPDPNGVFQHRYWDGRAWTEHVSRDGVTSLAPVVPVAPAAQAPRIAPDWFPDPAGRHQWRFWGGDDWTPHVNDDGRHADDPLTGSAPPPAAG
jgi:hypothetical protein